MEWTTALLASFGMCSGLPAGLPAGAAAPAAADGELLEVRPGEGGSTERVGGRSIAVACHSRHPLLFQDAAKPAADTAQTGPTGANHMVFGFLAAVHSPTALKWGSCPRRHLL